jgi:predicted nucleic acid-binding protein
MPPLKILLDTDILSELFKQIDPKVHANAARYQLEHAQLTFTSLSALEVLSGLERKQATAKLKRMQALLDMNEEIEPVKDDYRLAAEIVGRLGRSGFEIGLVDPIIAACAIRTGLGVATGNFDHFDYIRQVGYGYHLENWRDG